MMKYHKDWTKFIKENYEEIVKLGFWVTNNYCDIDFIHDTIIDIKRYKSLEKFDKSKSTIQTYIGQLFKFQWYNKQKRKIYKAVHVDIMDFNTALEDDNISDILNISTIKALPLKPREMEITLAVYDGQKPLDISNKINTTKYRATKLACTCRRNNRAIRDKILEII